MGRSSHFPRSGFGSLWRVPLPFKFPSRGRGVPGGSSRLAITFFSFHFCRLLMFVRRCLYQHFGFLILAGGFLPLVFWGFKGRALFPGKGLAPKEKKNPKPSKSFSPFVLCNLDFMEKIGFCFCGSKKLKNRLIFPDH